MQLLFSVLLCGNKYLFIFQTTVEPLLPSVSVESEVCYNGSSAISVLLNLAKTVFYPVVPKKTNSSIKSRYV